MREILFKAKRIDNGKWAEGCLVIDHSRSSLFEYRMRPVESGALYAPPINPETICQFTGLCDKNGKRIWENDIVFVTDENDCSGQISTGIGDVIFIEGMWYIDGRPQEGLYDINKVFQIEVIGNAFDNQELLQEESDE